MPYGAHLATRGELGGALEQWQYLRGKTQQALPPALDAAIGAACDARAGGADDAAPELARRAIACAVELRFL